MVAPREGERTDFCGDDPADDAGEEKRCKQRPSDPTPVEDRKPNTDCDDARPNDVTP